MGSDPNVVQHCLEIYPEPFTISFDPNSYVIPPLVTIVPVEAAIIP